MIVHAPQIEERGGVLAVSARVDVGRRDLPDAVWFEVPARFGDLLVARADAFAALLCPLAMALGEDLDVRGPLSPRLLLGLREWQEAVHAWLPGTFRVARVEAAELSRPAGGGSVAAAFSGGVDSFYTLWCHLAKNEPVPELRVGRALFVQGIDIDAGEAGRFDELARAYAELLARHGVELVPIRTNAKDFSRRLRKGFRVGTMPMAAALALGAGLARFLSPASHVYDNLEPWASHPGLDYLLATETLEVVYHGGGLTRLDKLRVLADWEATHTHLRVCRRGGAGAPNCGRCQKCIGTMVRLEVLGALSHYAVFPPLEGRHVRRVRFVGLDDHFVAETLEPAFRTGRYRRVLDLACAAVVNRTPLRRLLAARI